MHGGEGDVGHAVDLANLANPDVLSSAMANVRANGGGAGIDGFTAEAFAQAFEYHLPLMQAEILSGAYHPCPVRALPIPKRGGGRRVLGIPTARDRVVLEALRFLLSPLWEPTFSPASFAYRPGRSAVDAVAMAQRHLAEGNHWVVDLDIEKFFDNVDHVRLMLRLGQRVSDTGIMDLIADFLRSGRQWPDGSLEPVRTGIPQGSPLSPLLANIVLDELDLELARNSLPFVRYADDCIVLAPSQAAAEAILSRVEQFLRKRLNLNLNRSKTRVVPPNATAFLGFTYRIGRYGKVGRTITRAARDAFKERLSELGRIRKGDSLELILARVSAFVRGWSAYYGMAGEGVIRWAKANARAVLRSVAWQSWGTPEERARRLVGLGIDAATAESEAFKIRHPCDWASLDVLVKALPDSWFEAHGLGCRMPQKNRGRKPTMATLRAELARLLEENARLRAEIALCRPAGCETAGTHAFPPMSTPNPPQS